MTTPTTMAASGLLGRAATVALNFVRDHTHESCTRLCALLCCVTGCSAAVATVCFAFRNPPQAATVGALVGVTSALIAAGCVALLTRTRSLQPTSLLATRTAGLVHQDPGAFDRTDHSIHQSDGENNASCHL